MNMALKNLFCFDGIDGRRFQYCHMPLDSYILQWYNKKAVENNKEKCATPWSNLSRQEYEFIQQRIREYLISERNMDGAGMRLPAQPLQAEFMVWEEEKYQKNGR